MKIQGMAKKVLAALVGLMLLTWFSPLSSEAKTKSKRAKTGPPPEESMVIQGEGEEEGRDVLHKVREGEELHMLAAYYYGDARQWPKIYQHNRDLIKNPNRIENGTILSITVPEDWKPYMSYEKFFQEATAGSPPPAEATTPPAAEEKKEEMKPAEKKPAGTKPEEKKAPGKQS